MDIAKSLVVERCEGECLFGMFRLVNHAFGVRFLGGRFLR